MYTLRHKITIIKFFFLPIFISISRKQRMLPADLCPREKLHFLKNRDVRMADGKVGEQLDTFFKWIYPSASAIKRVRINSKHKAIAKRIKAILSKYKRRSKLPSLNVNDKNRKQINRKHGKIKSLKQREIHGTKQNFKDLEKKGSDLTRKTKKKNKNLNH